MASNQNIKNHKNHKNGNRPQRRNPYSRLSVIAIANAIAFTQSRLENEYSPNVVRAYHQDLRDLGYALIEIANDGLYQN